MCLHWQADGGIMGTRMRRREFLVRSIKGVGSILLASKLACVGRGVEPKIETFDPYGQVRLGKTQIKVSRVGFGTGMRGWMRESNHTRMGKEKFEALLRTAYERGVRLFDVADLYGTHPYLAGGLSEIARKDYVIVSKIWWRPNGLPEKERPGPDIIVQRFLNELNTDYIDIILLHCVTSANWPGQVSEQMDILAKLKKKGIIRAHGVSCHSVEALAAAVNEPWVDSVHARINAYGVQMDDAPEKVAGVLKKLHQAGKGVVGMKLIGAGQFRDSDEKRNESIRYVLGLGCVDTMVVGFEKVEEIDDFAARVRKVEVSALVNNAG